MHIYFSGIGGVGIGPLAEIALDAGYTVSGSDLKPSAMTEALESRGAHVQFGQDGTQIARTHQGKPIDWFVYTAALPPKHAELLFARSKGIRLSKRDELLAEIIKDKELKLIAVSGTHGKTTTTGLMVWTLRQLHIDVSYSVGSTLSFGPSGVYVPSTEYFVYECDEFDRNMLHFEPFLTLVTSLDHDHFDTYPTSADYRQAFVSFIEQSNFALMWEKDLRFLKTDLKADLEIYDELMDLTHLQLPGDHVRHNAHLVERAVMRLFPDLHVEDIRQAIASFPGTGRRMEKLADNLYSDYAHHPTEIAATLQMAKELSDHVSVVYQPHQNSRQYEVKHGYKDAFDLAEHVYWLPTYLSREDPTLAVLTPKELSATLGKTPPVTVSALDDELWAHISKERAAGHLVLCVGAGDIDPWLRKYIDKSN